MESPTPSNQSYNNLPKKIDGGVPIHLGEDIAHNVFLGVGLTLISKVQHPLAKNKINHIFSQVCPLKLNPFTIYFETNERE